MKKMTIQEIIKWLDGVEYETLPIVLKRYKDALLKKLQENKGEKNE